MCWRNTILPTVTVWLSQTSVKGLDTDVVFDISEEKVFCGYGRLFQKNGRLVLGEDISFFNVVYVNSRKLTEGNKKLVGKENLNSCRHPE